MKYGVRFIGNGKTVNCDLSKESDDMKERLKYLILPVITLILEILPYGAVCNFARPAEDGSIGHFRELYSYFDLIPFGYANFAPFITAVISCVIFLMLLLYCITDKRRFVVTARNILWVCTVLSLGPLVLGVRFFSVVGALITVSLIAELVWLQFMIKMSKQ